jgi:arylsulfatase A-like enzyme
LPEYAKTPPADAVRSPTFQVMRQWRDAGKLTEAQQMVFKKPAPEEELFDAEADSFEMNNLADDPAYAEHLAQFRKELAAFQDNTQDVYPAFRTPDEFDREEGTPLPNRERPRPTKKEIQSGTTQ